MIRWNQAIGIALCMIVLAAISTLPTIAQPQIERRHQQGACPALQTPSDEDGGELSEGAKSQAFSDVIGENGSYEDYRFALDGEAALPAAVMSVIVKSIAGIESGWVQYQNGQTLMRQNEPGSCDYGIMQINSSSASDLFSKSPSLRSSTRGNIAAGTAMLASKWNSGANGPLPIVNDGTSERLINWYYALSAYNGGPSENWANNPNCGQRGLQFDCGGANFSASRDPNTRTPPWNWSQLPPASFPYQERILYNLQFPRFPNDTHWTVGNLGLKSTTTPYDYGIRPDDALFLNDDGTSAAANLLLFRHRVSRVNTALASQTIAVEFDLPLNANVTVQILDSQGNVVATPVAGIAGKTGWNMASGTVATRISAGYRYRIRALRGTPFTPEVYYLGQYTQLLDTYSTTLASNIFLPFISGTAASTEELRNSSLREVEADISYQPQYWDLQGIFGSDTTLSQQIQIRDQDVAPTRFFHLQGAANGRVELVQRLYLWEDNTYYLKLSGRANNVPSGSQLQVRVQKIDTNNSGALLLDKPITFDSWWTTVITPITLPYGAYSLSLLATFGPSDTTSEFDLAGIWLIRQ